VSLSLSLSLSLSVYAFVTGCTVPRCHSTVRNVCIAPHCLGSRCDASLSLLIHLPMINSRRADSKTNHSSMKNISMLIMIVVSSDRVCLSASASASASVSVYVYAGWYG
jgi:hypothetical protein